MAPTNNSLRLSVLVMAMIAAAGVAVAGLLVGQGTAWAQSTPNTITVDTTEDESTDDGDCSLREAIESANADSGQVDGCAAGNSEDEIVFEVGQTATITLGSVLPTITDADRLSIDGENASITISGNDQVPVFRVGSGAQLTLERLTLADGFATTPEPNGAGLQNLGGTVTVINSTFSGNTVEGTGGQSSIGAGIDNNSGTLTVINSTFSNNSADVGGGMNNNFGTLTVTNSTFSNNSASAGGGIFNWPGAMLTVTNSTFSGNSAGAGRGAAIDAASAPTLKNTIVANSTQGDNCFGPITDGGYNIDDGTTCGFSTTNNSQPSTPPLLDPNGLQDNGGPTKTIALQEGSPAIDQGNSFGSTTDQRGEERPQDDPAVQNATGGDGSDIGAYEVEVNNPPVAQKDTYTMPEGQRSLNVPASTGVLANDSDPEGDTLEVSLVRAPRVGTLKLRADGSFVYKMPKKTYERNEFNGVAFVYEVSDGAGNTDRAKVTINKVQ